MPQGMPTNRDSARCANRAIFEPIERPSAQQRQCRSYFERGRRAQPGAFRHRAADQQVGGPDGETEQVQLARHPDYVVAPVPPAL